MRTGLWAAVLLAGGMALPSVAQADQVKQTFLGCKSKQSFERVHEIFLSGDTVAWEKALTAAFAAQECGLLETGKTVFAADRAWPGLVCLRPEGEVFCLWTLREVIKGF